MMNMVNTITTRIMRTELGNGTLVSTVLFDNGVYETMVFDNEDNMEELDCHRTSEYADAIEMHMEFVQEYLNRAEVEEQEEEQPTNFVVGGVYETVSICNSDCVFSYKVEKVTDKTVVIADKFGKTKRCKIHTEGSVPFIFPEGQYSMCPVIETTDLVK